MRERKFSSALAPYIEGLIREKRSNGYIYEFQAYILEFFDKFVIENGFDDGTLSPSLIEAWSIQRTTEGKGYRNQRVSFVRQLSVFMFSLGLNAYIPDRIQSNTFTPDPYILSRDEITDLMSCVDSFIPRQKVYIRLARSYSVLFRLYYCCGLRLAEGVNLRRVDVDLDRGILMIFKSNLKVINRGKSLFLMKLVSL